MRLGNNLPQNPSKPTTFSPLAFTGNYVYILHELDKVIFQNKVKTIIEVKARKKSKEIKWMICINLVHSSYEICKLFSPFQRKVNNYPYFYSRKGGI